jgi:hypothetical protein
MTVIRTRTALSELEKLVEPLFDNMVKAVVDVRRRVIAVGGALHSDEETLLLEDGSEPDALWGVNIYTDVAGPGWIEFDSMINLRPTLGNRSRGVDDPKLREAIQAVVEELVAR